MSDTQPPTNGGKRDSGRHTSRGRQNITGGSTAGSPAGPRSQHPSNVPPSNVYEPLPPELDPRGRRAAHARIRETARTNGPPATAMGADGRTTGQYVARGALLATKIVAALLSLTVVISSYWVWNTWNNFTTSIAHGDPLSPYVPPSGSGSASAPGGPKDIDGPDQNILLLGNDSRAGATPLELAALGTADDGGSANTDTMMIMHIPGNGKAASVMSFPRDSYIDIPGYGMQKLNAAYPDAYYAAKNAGKTELQSQSAGIQLLGQTLQKLTGLKIDHYVQINLLGFYRISIAIGGVPVVLCGPQQERNSGINLPAGLSVIKGKQAMAFVRQRYGLPLGDLDRINRQQYFLRSVFHKMLSSGTLLNPLKVQSLLGAVSKSLVTDPTIDFLQLASTFAAMSEGNLSLQTIPTDGFDNNTPAGSVVVVHPADVQAFAAAFVGKGGDSKLSSAPTVSAASVDVVVLNASHTDNIATHNRDALVALGFKATVGTNLSGVIARTEIDYPDGMQSQAKTLAAQVPGAIMVKTSAVTTVTLKIGDNGVQTKTLGSAATGSTAASSKAPTKPAAVPVVGVGQVGVRNQPGCIN